MSLSRLHLVSVSLYSMSSLQYRRCTLIRLLPLCLSRLHLSIRPDIYVHVFLAYRQYTLQSVPSVLPPFSLRFRRQLSTFIISPSSMYPRTPPLSTFNTSRFPLGAPSVSIHLSQCRLLCPCVAHSDVCVTILGTSFIANSSFHLLLFQLPSAF
jgi:hypothetical protein